MLRRIGTTLPVGSAAVASCVATSAGDAGAEGSAADVAACVVADDVARGAAPVGVAGAGEFAEPASVDASAIAELVDVGTGDVGAEEIVADALRRSWVTDPAPCVEGSTDSAAVVRPVPAAGRTAAACARMAGEKACGLPTIRRSGETRAAVLVAAAGGAARTVAPAAALGRPAAITRRNPGTAPVAAPVPTPGMSPTAFAAAPRTAAKRALGGAGRHDGELCRGGSPLPRGSCW